MSRVLIYIILVVCITTGSTFSFAASAPDINNVKAAYLYNFAKFINWPDNSFANKKTPFVIGVLGLDKFDSYLQPLTTKSVNNRPIIIKHFKTAAEVQDCQILYLGELNNQTRDRLISTLSTQAIITVSDQNEFARQGGIIQFVEVRHRLRFIINKTAADHQNIKISSQLLALAINVLEDTP